MSAGKFTRGRYESDAGTIYPCRYQPETASFSVGATNNTAPAGPIQSGVPHAEISKGKRQFGVGCRQVGVTFTGALPDGYAGNSVIYIPILTKSAFDAIALYADGTYLGSDVQVVSKKQETIR
jgi:hypothetical protein